MKLPPDAPYDNTYYVVDVNTNEILFTSKLYREAYDVWIRMGDVKLVSLEKDQAPRPRS